MFKGSRFSTSLPTFDICGILDDSCLTKVRWYLILFICVSLKINECWPSFICLLSIYMYLEKYLFWSSAWVLNRMGFWLLICMRCCSILDIHPLSLIYVQIFYPFYRLSFKFVSCFFLYEKASKFNLVLSVYFCFYFFCLRRDIKKYCCDLCQSVFSSESFVF